MTNMLETASKWLSDQLDEHVSSAVHYRRGSTVVPLVAGKGRTQFETTDAFNMLILVESRDFLISTTAILLDGVQSLPQVGD